MFSNSQNRNSGITGAICLAVLNLVVICVLAVNSYACGGGVIPFIPSDDPYVPPGTGDEIGSTLDGTFFLDLEKGVVNEMFDVKKFNPLFRHLTLSGNERRTMSRSTREKQDEDPPDSSALPPCGVDHPVSEPILNLHRLH